MYRMGQWPFCMVLVWRNSIHFWRRYAQKTIFTFSFLVTLSLYMSNLLHTCSYSCSVSYVSTKLEVSTASWFRENRTDNRQNGQTDRVQHLMWPLGRTAHNYTTHVSLHIHWHFTVTLHVQYTLWWALGARALAALRERGDGGWGCG